LLTTERRKLESSRDRANGGKGWQTDIVDLTENARVVLEKRYLRRNAQGEIVETPEEMLLRVAGAIAAPEYANGGVDEGRKWERKFYGIMANLQFLPNSPTLMNAGILRADGLGTGTLSACFVMGLEDHMDGIMTTAKETAMVQKYGGGTGFALSAIRPKGSTIQTTHGQACGPIEVLRHLSSVSKLVTQGGKRDGANMAVMDVHHPDILEFIDCKAKEGEIHNFNVSVGVTHEFMQAVNDGTTYPLRFHQDPADLSSPIVETGRLDAREVFEKIVQGAWRNGEPGMVFLDWVNHRNPTPHVGRITATNPCGEQPLLPYESCNLGSINLSKFVVEIDGSPTVDYVTLREVVRTATRFLDNVIDVNSYSVDKIEEMTKATRKIGLGVMGFADLLTRLQIPYDSEQGLALGRQIMRFIRDEADRTSTQLAEERGNFPAYEGSVYDSPDGPPMRNACRLTVAPTGTISMIAGCSSGVEPLFALCYRKHNILGGESLLYVDGNFEKAAKNGGFYSEDLMKYLADGGSLQEREDAPAWAKRTFVVAGDISPEMHVRMQAAFQESVDSAISKTINFPNDATEDDVREAYMLAWELGCKGITVYRSGSRTAEVLTAGVESEEGTGNGQGSPSFVERQRPPVVQGVTERVRTGQGNLFVTVNFDDDGRLFEVFGTLGKAGSTDSARLEAITRLASLGLRTGIDPEQIIEQLQGITDEPVWSDGRLVLSVPDAISHVLQKHLRGRSAADVEGQDASTQIGLFPSTQAETRPPQAIGDRPLTGKRCPECSAYLIAQESCLNCPDCGYSKCD